MRAVIEILDGPLAGRTIPLTPGQTFSVGRTAKSQLMLPHDGFLSGLHFQVECGDDAILLKDCNSSNGTFVNGNKAGTQLLANGDEIIAGQTHFRIHLDAVLPQPEAESTRTTTVMLQVPRPQQTAMMAVPTAALTPAQQWIVNYLRAQPAPLYALLDAVVEPRVSQMLVTAGEPYDILASVTPHLVQLSPESPLLPMLVREGWGKGWATFLTCPRPFAELRTHLRLFTSVQLEDGRRMPFRFYNPRLLQVWLAGCSVEELGMFFGPIFSLAIEDICNPGQLIEYRVMAEGLARTVHPVG